MSPQEFSEDFDREVELFETTDVHLTAPDATKDQWGHFNRNLPPVVDSGDTMLNSQGEITIPSYRLGRFQTYARKVLGPTAVSSIAKSVLRDKDAPKDAKSQFTEEITLPSGGAERIVTSTSFTSYFRGVDEEWDGREAHFQRIWNLLAGDAVNNPNSPLTGIIVDGDFKGITLVSFLATVRQLGGKRYKVDGVGADWGTRMLEGFAKEIDPTFSEN